MGADGIHAAGLQHVVITAGADLISSHHTDAKTVLVHRFQALMAVTKRRYLTT